MSARSKSKSDLAAVWGSVDEERTIATLPYLQLFEKLSDGVMVYRAVDQGKDFVIVDMNQSAERISNLKRKDAVGKLLTDMFPGVEKAGLLEVFRRVNELGEAEDIPIANYKDAKRDLWVENSVISLGEGMIVATFTDVTERKTAEDALKASETELRAIIENLNEVLYRVDATGVLEYVSLSILSMFGYQPEDVVGESFMEYVHPEDQTAMQLNFKAGLAGDVSPDDFRMRAKDGSYKWVRTTSQPIRNGDSISGITGMLCDITDQRKTELALMQAKAKYEDLYQNAPDMFVSVDAVTARITECNATLCEATGYTREEIVDKPIFDMYHPDSLDRAQETFELFSRKGEIQNAELELMKKDGTKIYVILNVMAERDSKGYIVRSRSSWRDISDIKRFEDELERSNRSLAKAAKDLKESESAMIQRARLSALGEMASGIAHDFNNVLMPIVGLSDFLLQNPKVLSDREEALSVLEQINEAADDARNIVQRLRLIHKGSGEQDNKEALLLDGIVKSSVKLTAPRWKQEMSARGTPIELEMSLQGGRKNIQGNASELREMIMNLLLNAVDAMPEGGTLSVKTIASSDVITLQIADTGEGMDEEQLQHCLEAFYTTKGVKGTGLGLSMVNGIVERHSGSLEISSKKDEGTTIEILLPFAGAVVRPDAPIAAVSKVATMKILAVDDDPRSLRLIKLLLQNDGHDVHALSDGKEALKLLKQEKFDLVVSDRAMPDVRGDAVLNLAKLKNPDGLTIMLTGFGDIMNDEGELPDGVDKVMSKPVTRDDFRSVIGGMIDASGTGYGI